MGCFGSDREKQAPKEHHWDFFNLSDFKSNSCWAPFSYGILYITLGVSIACYVLDVLTCVQLIISDRWAGQITPVVSFEITRWIFSGCILLSFVLLIYRWWKAIRAMKSGSVVASYLDPLAVRIESIRMGRGQGWRRFLVFSALTKSKKGAEYVALFSYLSFEASVRIIFAEGPRQVINALTIISIMQSEIVPLDNGKHAAPKGVSPFVQFFLNVKVLAQDNPLRAVVFFGMLFTLLIWVIAALSLISSCLLYLVFLWHHIPSGSGGLRGYCKKKADGKLQAIVDKKIKKAFEREERMRAKEEAKMAKSGIPVQGIKKQPTLPVLTSSDDKLPGMPTLSRQPTFATLPEYDSRPGTPSAQLPGYGVDAQRPGMPSRTATGASNASYASQASNAPLMGAAASMGYSQPPRPYSPAGMSNANSMAGGPPPLGRSLTGQSQASQTSQGSLGYGQRPANQMRPTGPPRQNTNASQFGPERQFTPAPSVRSNTPLGNPQFAPGPPRRQNTGESNNGGYFPGPDRSDSASVVSANSGYGRRTPGPPSGRPGPEQNIEMQYRPQASAAPANQFRPYSPALSSGPQVPREPRLPFAAPPRNFSSPAPHASSDSFDRSYPPQRSGTAPHQAQYYNAPQSSQFDSRPSMPTRSNTAGPSYDEWPQHGL